MRDLRHWLLAAAVALALWLGLSLKGCGPAPTPLPRDVAQQRERHQVASAVDSAHVQELQARARADATRAAAAQRVAARATRAAALERQRADSLAQVAETTRDSGAAWHLAYTARTAERDSLQVALASQAARADAADSRAARLDSVAQLERGRRQRADSLVASLVPLAERREDRCRVLRVLPCPTRTQAAIGAAIVVLAASQAHRGNLRIKLPP